MTKATFFLEKLVEAGYESYFVGGCVRDKVLGRNYNDQDIATSASPEEVKEVLNPYAESMDFVGANFGVTICDGIEIAMFRSEKYDVVGKPTVIGVQSAKEDASRRDFTINALFETVDGRILDYFDGLKDIQDKKIRAVGDAKLRFKEDPSRILRAAYLAASLGFEIEEKTKQEMSRMKNSIKLIPDSLKGKIFVKSFKNKVVHKFLHILGELDLIEVYLPELSHTMNLPQNPAYHHLNVWEHILKVIEETEKRNLPLSMVLAAVFHDNAKGLPGIRGENKEGQPNDLEHEIAGVEPARMAMNRFEFGGKEIDLVTFIIQFHGIRVPLGSRNRSYAAAIRKMVPYARNKEELISKVQWLETFMEMDALGFTPVFSSKILEELEVMKLKFSEVFENKIFYREELPVTGKDLIQYGFKGKEVGEMLQRMVEANMKDREVAISYLERKTSSN